MKKISGVGEPANAIARRPAKPVYQLRLAGVSDANKHERLRMQAR